MSSCVENYSKSVSEFLPAILRRWITSKFIHRCKLEAFTHVSNVVHTAPDSLVLAAILNKVLQPLLPGETSVKGVLQPDEGAEDRRTARR